MTINRKYTYNTTTYQNGDLVKSSTDNNGIAERYTYDDNKNCIRKDYDTGKILTYTYDKDGKILSKKLYENEGQLQSENSLGEIAYTYDSGDNITKIQSGNNTFHFAYTQFGELSSIKHGSQSLVSYAYKSNSNRILSKITYGNETGDGKNTISYTYNDKNQLTDDGQAAYAYQTNGEIKSIQDRVTGITTTWEDDKRTAIKDGTLHYEYEETEDTIQFRNGQGTLAVSQGEDSSYMATQTFSFDNENLFTKSNGTDKFGHKTTESVKKVGSTDVALLNKAYEYRMIGEERVTDQISKVTTTYGSTTESEAITYDTLGNIATITDEAGNETSYVYDKKGQLTRENNKKRNRTTVYTYDNDGNITKKQEYAYTKGTVGTVLFEKNYTYGNAEWGDLLTEYDGQTIQYDSIGNPTEYRGRELTWEKGRQLTSSTRDGVTTTYQYDVNGLRTKKTVGTEEYEYTYVDDTLCAMKSAGVEMIFAYDSDGNPFSVWYNGNKYLYQTNLQGDVVGIIDESGTKVESYSYDAYGKLLNIPTSVIGRLNPLRYRGYVYDTDTGWYYLQSRYYDAETGRFLNADDARMLLAEQESILSKNLFTYALNNPVVYKDETGYYVQALPYVIVGIGVGLFLVLTVNYVNRNKAELNILGKQIKNFISSTVDNFRKITVATAKVTAYVIRKAVKKAHEKIIETVKILSKNPYWTATWRGDYVDIGRQISRKEAITEVKKGRNVFTTTKTNARDIAKAAGGGKKPIGAEIDKGKKEVIGYYWHFHTYNRNGAHVYYLYNI